MRKLAIPDERVVAAYQQAPNARAVARTLGIGATTVYRILERSGVRRVGTPPVPRYVPPYALVGERASEVLRRYEQGESPRALARDFGVSVWSVRATVKRLGGRVHPRGNRYRAFTDDHVNRMVQLWHEGVSQTAIARAFGTSQAVVSRVLAQRSIRVRPRRQIGPGHGAWKGGRVLTGGGYVQVIYPPDGPFAEMRNRQGYILEHRLVMAQELGRPLSPTETVHHRDGNRANNSPDNLELRAGPHGKGATAPHCRTCSCFED